MAAWVARTTTSCDRGTGSGRSATDITSGPPAPLKVTAIMRPGMMSGMSPGRHADALAAITGPEHVLVPAPHAYLADATAMRGLEGQADAVVLPASEEQVAAVVGYCYANDVPITPRGGGSGFAAGPVRAGAGVRGDRRGRRYRCRGGGGPRGAAGGDGRGRGTPDRGARGRGGGRAVAMARRRVAPGRGEAGRQALRGHRGAARPAGRGDPGHARDRRPARRRGAELGPCRRRQPPLALFRRPGGRPP